MKSRRAIAPKTASNSSTRACMRIGHGCPAHVVRDDEAGMVRAGKLPEGPFEGRDVLGTVPEASTDALEEKTQPATAVLAVKRRAEHHGTGDTFFDGGDHSDDVDPDEWARPGLRWILDQAVGRARPTPKRRVTHQPHLHGVADLVAEPGECSRVDERLVGAVGRGARPRRSLVRSLPPPAVLIEPHADSDAGIAVGDDGLAGV